MRRCKSGESAAKDLINNKTLLIFDVDGTIADSSPVHATAFNEVLAAWGISVDYGDIAGLATEATFCRVLAGANVPFDAAKIERLARDKREAARRLLPLTLGFVPGAEQFLRFARPRFRMAVWSSGSRQTIKMTLRQLSVDQMFDMIVAREDVARSKPAPDGLLLILRALGVPAQQALVFEDAAPGIEASIRGGVDVVHVAEGNEPPIAGAILRSDWPRLLGIFQEALR